jgi:N-acetyl-gamma-glutamyl-phosphate reductase
MSATVPTVVLGGSGYVAGELLRLLASHPWLRPLAVVSESQAGGAVESAFPHLAGCFPGLEFSDRKDLPGLIDGHERLAVLCAAPHGAAAPLLDEVLGEAERVGCAVKAVDISADFRFADAAGYEKVYGHAHGAPGRLAQFRCAVPEHLAETPEGHVGHPGCFVTATLLAAVPLLKLGLVEPRLSVVAVTGSTGAGRTPTATTHHPARRSTLFAYNPLKHRHEPEMRTLAAAAAGVEAEIHFVPQAGPFARGIYATLQARLLRPMESEEVRQALAGFYAGSPFVDVLAEPPRLQDVVGTNRARLSVATDGDHLVVFSALDNLVKGAAGGAVQWMNRLLGFPETAGLTTPGLGWM